MNNHTTLPTGSFARPRRRLPVAEILLAYILIVGALLRLTPYMADGKLAFGINWGEESWLHPDERFLLMVGNDIDTVKSLGEYFNTAKSSLNPANRGHGFFVYGTLPLVATRYLTEFVYQTIQHHHSISLTEISNIGRPLSALSDVLVILLVYLIAVRLYNKRVGVLAAAFYAMAVLPIQLSHYFKEDTFTNFFVFLAIYFAVLLATSKWREAKEREANGEWQTADERVANGEWRKANEQVANEEWQIADEGVANEGKQVSSLTIPNLSSFHRTVSRFTSQSFFWLSIGFGFAVGCALASKVLAAPIVLMLPAALAVRMFTLPANERKHHWGETFGYLVVGAIASFITFRIFQPYAFRGTSFFDIWPEKGWFGSLASQRAQFDIPPSMQWARRPIWFAAQNLTVWGLGTPLGILAWIGFFWATWRILKGEWHRHALVWGWTAGYFIFQMWQSHFNPTMRYFLPMYPTLVILAAWVVIWLYDRGKRVIDSDLVPAFSDQPSPGSSQQLGDSRLSIIRDRLARINSSINWSRWVAVLACSGVLLYTFAYAYAFTKIYARPITRLAASRWIYQNVAAPIDVTIETETSPYNVPLPFRDNYYLFPDDVYEAAFNAHTNGTVNQISLNNLTTLSPLVGPTKVSVTLTGPEDLQATGSAELVENADKQDYVITLDQTLPITQGVIYTIKLRVEGGGSISLSGDVLADEGDWDDPLPYSIDGYSGGGIYPDQIKELVQFYATTTESNPDLRPKFNMYWDENLNKLGRFESILDAADYITFSSNRQWGSLPRMPERFPLSTEYYRNLLGCPEQYSINWCYSVAEPGMFTGNLGFELVETFTSEPEIGLFKLNSQFADEAFTVYDHPKVFIFKKTADYSAQQMRDILGAVDLTHVIHLVPNKAGSYPADLMLPVERLAEQIAGGTWSDIFNYDALVNRYEVLGVIVWYLWVFLLGLFVYPLMRLAFSGLEDRGYPLARIAGLLLLAWLVWMAGSARIPFTRWTITAAVLLLAILGAALAFFQRKELEEEWRSRRKYFLMIEVLFLLFFLFDLLIRIGNPDLWHPYKGGERPMELSYFNAIMKSTSFPPYDPWYAGGYLNYYYYGYVVVGTLVKWLGIVPTFAFNLIIPTLFSLTAMGAFSVAWNIYKRSRISDQPTAVSDQPSAFSEQPSIPNGGPAGTPSFKRFFSPLIRLISFAIRYLLTPFRRLSAATRVGLAAAILMVVLGNLGTVRVYLDGFQRLGITGDEAKASILTKAGWTLSGLGKFLSGTPLPIPPGDWYWIPSRIIPDHGGNEITEFPFFTFLYGDLHAHMIAMPVALLALAWAVSTVFGRAKWKGLAGFAASIFLGCLAIGAQYPINLSDTYTYLLLGMIAIGYTLWVYLDVEKFRWIPKLPKLSKRLLLTAGGILLVAGLATVLYQPYRAWYGQAYGSIQTWKGARTPFHAYFEHWGLFLFVIVSWMAWETRDWMARTPLSALRKLKPYVGMITTIPILLFMVMLIQQAWVAGWLGKLLGRLDTKWPYPSIIWLALPLAAWAGVLILRPGLSDAKRVVLFLFGTGLAITLMVDIIAVRGDIGRMNTVFKFYLQVWALFAVCAAAALGWLFMDIKHWLTGWRIPWKVVLYILVCAAGLYTVRAGWDKIQDRWTTHGMATQNSNSLDGMTYMQFVTYPWQGVNMDLSRDYRAIRWVQENIQGSPVIVEAVSGDNYRWYNRFTIYTGLPGVVGWVWHQQQHRELLPDDWVSNRQREVNDFYETFDIEKVKQFLHKYDIRYIVVGQLEQATYPGMCLDKFPQYDGNLWRRVYPAQGVDPANETVIYEVIQP